jgi:hypothetical protein
MCLRKVVGQGVGVKANSWGCDLIWEYESREKFREEISNSFWTGYEKYIVIHQPHSKEHSLRNRLEFCEFQCYSLMTLNISLYLETNRGS